MSQRANSGYTATPPEGRRKRGKSVMDLILRLLLRLMAWNLNWRRSKRDLLRSDEGWINFTIGMRTENDSISCAIRFENGRVNVLNHIPEEVESLFILKNDGVVKEILRDASVMMVTMLNNKLLFRGNLNYPLLFGYYISQFAKTPSVKPVSISNTPSNLAKEFKKRGNRLLRGKRVDSGVKYLEDPYLSDYSLDDFPRLREFLDTHFTQKPEICVERPKLLTDWFKQNGFETDREGNAWIPELRQGLAFRHLMENKKAIINKNDLIAGTTTTKTIGVVVYPDSSGSTIWSELNTIENRQLNAYKISEETKRILHREIFPYWIGNRSFREWVRERFQNPLCQQLDERFAVYFLWKTVALSHTIPDFPKLLSKGTKAMIEEVKAEMSGEESNDERKSATRRAMILCLEGITIYAGHLSEQAKREASEEANPKRKTELLKLSTICANVPANPCRTLHEAVNALWITWIALHMENTNAGLSLGRLDQWLQPYFLADLEDIETELDRRVYLKEAIELIGCLYTRCTDHLPLVADIGNYLFGGSSSDQAITLGGQTPEGEDAVNDMTYIFLKVTEMLSIRDPNVNARYAPGVNSETYLRRLCEVNLITTATPSLHNDDAVIKSLEEFHYDARDVRDWSATGCVEPTLSGKHLSHTNCMMMNIVAALEMALNNGVHPLMRWKVGPDTGGIETDDFTTFEDFFDAFLEQYRFLIDNAIQLNNMLGEAHTVIRPTPLLSSLIDGCVANGEDVTHGGAKYNSSGAACIGLADVTDSLMVIKRLVFEERRFSFKRLKKAIDTNFENDQSLYQMIIHKTPRFGSGSSEALELANRVAKFTHDYFGAHTNFRGGTYTAGFWSMSNHVAFGSLSGALPSGKLAGKAFTPGLTPSPIASENLLDTIRDVSRLDPRNLNNNIAFNVKVVPSSTDSHEEIVNTIFSYVKTYFDLGGMQIQLNVVTSETLIDAMNHPEEYRDLIVRISGYNAYFVTLNKEMQMELIERAEYGLS